MSTSPLAIARACLQAYVDKDRSAIEALLDDDFHFTSPLDNALDRATYFEICWPNSTVMASFENLYEFEQGDRACIVYEADTTTGERLRNAEVYTVAPWQARCHRGLFRLERATQGRAWYPLGQGRMTADGEPRW